MARWPWSTGLPPWPISSAPFEASKGTVAGRCEHRSRVVRPARGALGEQPVGGASRPASGRPASAGTSAGRPSPACEGGSLVVGGASPPRDRVSRPACEGGFSMTRGAEAPPTWRRGPSHEGPSRGCLEGKWQKSRRAAVAASHVQPSRHVYQQFRVPPRARVSGGRALGYNDCGRPPAGASSPQ